MKDARRVDISLGDQVLYYKTGRYPTVIVGTVIEFKKKVKLGNLTSLSNKGDHPETCWADRRQLVVTGGLPLREEEKPVPDARSETEAAVQGATKERNRLASN